MKTIDSNSDGEVSAEELATGIDQVESGDIIVDKGVLDIIQNKKEKQEKIKEFLDPKMLLEPGGNDGALLSEKIDDKSAYLWKRYAHGFSTFFGHQSHSHYNRAHYGNLSPYSNGN